MLAVTSLSMRFCASARPMLTANAGSSELPERLAAAAIALASMRDASRAVTLIGPPAVTFCVPLRFELPSLASTTLSMAFRLTAPVALAAIDLSPVLRATLSATPKATESIRAVESAATVTAPSATTPVSSITAPWCWLCRSW